MVLMKIDLFDSGVRFHHFINVGVRFYTRHISIGLERQDILLLAQKAVLMLHSFGAISYRYISTHKGHTSHTSLSRAAICHTIVKA